MGDAERTASRRGSPFYVVGRAREGENKDVSRTTYYNSDINAYFRFYSSKYPVAVNFDSDRYTWHSNCCTVFGDDVCC